MRAFSVSVFLFFYSTFASAFVPPAFLLTKRIAEQHDPAKIILTKVGVYRPGSSPSESDSLLWEEYVAVPLSGTPRSPERWPGLSILLESDPQKLTEGLRRFGLAVVPETALLRHPLDKVRAMKEPPRPFYLPDPSMSLRTQGKRIAWVSQSVDSLRSFWVEKDSFFPIMLQGPCPETIEEVSWAKSSDLPCELVFESVTGLQSAKGGKVSLLLRRDQQSLLRFRLNKIFLNPSLELLDESKAKSKDAAEKSGALGSLAATFLN